MVTTSASLLLEQHLATAHRALVRAQYVAEGQDAYGLVDDVSRLAWEVHQLTEDLLKRKRELMRPRGQTAFWVNEAG